MFIISQRFSFFTFATDLFVSFLSFPRHLIFITFRFSTLSSK